MPGTELQAAKANVIFHGAQVFLSTLWSGSHCSGTTINGWQALSWPASLDISALSHATRYSQSALYRNLGSERRRSDAHKATGAPWPWSRRRSGLPPPDELDRSEEHTSELQSLMRISYAVFCLKKKKKNPY